jgi:hypothetical protein
VRVAQAFFDERELNVKVHLEAKTAIPSAQIVVGLLGLREGVIVEEKLQLLSSVYSKETLEAGQTLALNFSLKSDDLTEYQVRCSWGSDAARLAEITQNTEEIEKPQLNNARASLNTDAAAALKLVDGSNELSAIQPPAIRRPNMPERPLSLENVEISEGAGACADPPCDIYFVVKATIANHTDVMLEGVRLAIGLYWTEAGKLPRLPAQSAALSENEELIDLKGLKIGGGDSKAIRVKVDRSVPRVPGGSFIPHLRILE